ncbi:hypothetical protein [Puniceicoccus vermicola]|uniref:VWA domain-containing protein n=1 Tax=Puniceicoccus vermicola TaxID=388746 RepID=A0A7X1B0F2_9BACT|nr:hypothetical protein [Puniceicoccus vermicola]MBC2603174.1 hypothetical protein [Puniceicoccus vermicola]
MYRPSKKSPNKILWSIMLGILGVHLIALIAFGGWTVYQAVVPDDRTFEEPPSVEKIERVKLEYKVRMQQQQRKSQRPKQKLQVKQITDINMPDVDIQMPNINGAGGIGRFGENGFGDLSDGAGLNLGAVSVDLFDIKAKGEKFLFIVDVRKDLLQDAKGGIPTYRVIKEDVIRLINELPSGVLFNMILFDRVRMEIYQPQLVAATASNKKDFEQWLMPVNSSINTTGIRRRNYEPSSFKQPFAQRILSRDSAQNNAMLMVAVAGLEQRPDAIYILSDRMPDLTNLSETVRKSEKEIERSKKEFLDRIEERTEFDTVEEYRKARSATVAEISKRVQDVKRKEAAARAKKGIPPRVYSRKENIELRDRVEKQVAKDFKDYTPPISGMAQNESLTISERETLDWLEQQQRLFFDQYADERPQLNAIVFRGKDESVSETEEEVIERFVDIFDGDYRVLVGLGQIDSSAAAQ